MSKAEKETAIRNTVLNFLTEQMTAHFDSDVLPTSGSEITMPWVDDEGNEMWVLVKVSIPRGTRNGNGYDPFDGYAAAEDYKQDLIDKAAKKAASEEKKAKDIAERQRKAEAKKVIKELNEKGLDGMIKGE